jgi:uncharacterized protein (TIGR02594 family)
MRALTGTKEVPGPGSNPVIMAMVDEIAARYPDMEAYCAQYTDDDIAWCGVAAANCLAVSDIRPPYGKTDTTRWMWADSFRTDPNMVELAGPVLGCIVVMTRSGGNHVTLYESDAGSSINCRGGNQSNMVNVSSFPKSNVTGYMWPKDYPLPHIPPEDRPTVKKGSKGSYVVSVQNSLGVYPADGDFGSITDGAVRGFQAAAGLSADGVVGPNTWSALDALDQRKAEGDAGLDQDTIDAITQVAETSAIAGYNWKDRGRAPPGYIAGIACVYGLMIKLADAGNDITDELSQADRGDANTDALTWYRSQFTAAGMDNSKNSIDTMRHLFVMLMGLGMRESSGRYPEGRDQSATNVQADTAEAAFAQTSWNINTCNSLIPPLLPEYWDNPVGFLTTFQKGVTLKSSDLGGYGSGAGARYQFLAKFVPAFHATVTAIGMRYLRKHWGPINRNEVEIRRDADALLKEVEVIIEGGTPEPGPEPEPPDVAVASLSIDPNGGARVVVSGGAAPNAQVNLPEGVVPTITITVDPPGSVIVNVTGGAEEA